MEKANQMGSMISQNKKTYTSLKQADGSVFKKFEWMPDPIQNSKHYKCKINVYRA